MNQDIVDSQVYTERREEEESKQELTNNWKLEIETENSLRQEPIRKTIVLEELKQ